jgi:hypothetical protein
MRDEGRLVDMQCKSDWRDSSNSHFASKIIEVDLCKLEILIEGED